MDQHPMPRQITTFEFKLIGFLTLRQFLYLVIFIPLAFVVFKLFPIPILNILAAILVAGLGIGLAFLPINGRPLDIWIKNLVKRLTSPTQFVYKKNNPPLYFIQDLYFTNNPHIVMAHIESGEKLSQYLEKTQLREAVDQRRRRLGVLMQQPSSKLIGEQKKAGDRSKDEKIISKKDDRIPPQKTPLTKKPFFSGIVKNHRNIPLPGILIYVQDKQGRKIRLLKTNPYGVFATFRPLPPQEYIFAPFDPGKKHFFGPVKVKVGKENPKPLEIYSKEMM